MINDTRDRTFARATSHRFEHTVDTTMDGEVTSVPPRRRRAADASGPEVPEEEGDAPTTMLRADKMINGRDVRALGRRPNAITLDNALSL